MKRQLHTLDSLFLHLDAEHAQMGITPVYFYDPSSAPGGELSHEQLLSHLRCSIGALPVLRSRLERVPFDLDNPYLAEDPNFRLEDHVREVQLPAPGDWTCLSTLLADFQASHVATDGPLWEMLVIRGLDAVEFLPKGSFALAMKLHHVIADGHTVMEISAVLHDEGQAIVARNPARSALRYEAPPLMERMSRVVSNNVLGALDMMGPLFRTAPRMTRTLVEAARQRQPGPLRSQVKTRFNDKVSDKRIWDCIWLDLQAIKRLGKLRDGATINDVVLAIVAGALREYLHGKGDAIDTALRALAPINVRQEKEHHQAGNEVALFFPELPVQIEDAATRFEAVIQGAKEAKALMQSLGSRDLSDLTKSIPPAYLSYMNMLGIVYKTAESMLGMAGNTVVTNVPGPATALHLGGATLAGLTGLIMIGDGLGLNHAVSSYNGKLNIAVTACPKLMPDIGFYMSCLERSFQRLQQALEPVPAADTKPVKPARRRRSSSAGAASKKTSSRGKSTADGAAKATAEKMEQVAGSIDGAAPEKTAPKATKRASGRRTAARKPGTAAAQPSAVAAKAESGRSD